MRIEPLSREELERLLGEEWLMPVRLKVETRRVESSEGAVLVALVNTGLVSDEPDILVPAGVARALGLWPQPDGSLSVILGTAGGEGEGYVVP